MKGATYLHLQHMQLTPMATISILEYGEIP